MVKFASMADVLTERPRDRRPYWTSADDQPGPVDTNPDRDTGLSGPVGPLRNTPASSRVRPPQRRLRAWHVLVAATAAGFALLQAALRLRYLLRAPYLVDELEHLHGAYLVSRGARPYAGFFEHHPPLYYLGIGHLLPSAPGLSTLTAVRFIAAVAALATMALVVWWANRIGGRQAAVVTAVLALTNVFWLFTGSLALLDTFAGFLLVVMAIALTGTGRPILRAFVAGLALAGGMLMSQKLFLASVLPLAAAFGSWRRHGTRQTLRVAASALAGLIVVAGIVALLLGPAGVRGYWRDTWALNFRWKARHRPWAELRELARSGGPVYLVAAFGAGLQLLGLVRRRLRVVPADIVALSIAAYSLGALVLPVVWPEYFVSFVPFLVLMAGLAITAVGRRWQWGRAPLHLARRPITTPLRLVGATFAIVVFAAVPLAKQLGSRHADNAAQRARIAFVLAATRPDETVFDSYTGYGVFRRDAYRYWFLHDEVQLMLTDRQKGADIVAAIRSARPALMFTDGYTDTLPAAVRAEIRRVAVPTVFPDIWCRADLATRCANAGR